MKTRARTAVGFGMAAVALALSIFLLSSAGGRTATNAFADTTPTTLGSRQVQTPDALFKSVSTIAAGLAAQPYSYTPAELPRSFRTLGYDDYRKLRPRAEAAMWRGEPGKFSVLPVPRGFLFKDSIEVFIVDNGRIQPIADPGAFVDFQDFPNAPAEDRTGLGMSGWRALYPFNSTEKADESVVFQGGVYFRGLARGLVYGTSARALAIGTASRKGEEFPRFSHFWIFKPAPDSNVLNVAALMDTQSAAGAFLFAINPGDDTVMDVKSVIYPRTPITEVGVAAMSSMFLHNPVDRSGVDDYRPEVHDADGLAMLTGSGERIWRPLANPRDLQISQFMDNQPRGFGLMQRQRNLHAYEDLEARYNDRPSVWVEPQGDWGPGHVTLVEIPTDSEYNDNIVAFWRPNDALQPGRPYEMAYRLHWSGNGFSDAVVAKVIASRSGRHPDMPAIRKFIVDYSGDVDLSTAVPEVWASSGEVRNITLMPGDGNGRRLSFDLDPKGSRIVELRGSLKVNGVPQSETWLFRWTPD
jgi:glucans biosynthesis protein